MEKSEEIKKDDDSVPIKSFRIPPKKLGYGEYLLIFIFLTVIFNTYEQGIKPHSLSVLSSFFTTGIRIILDTTVLYFLTLWIMKLIRNRGKIERPEKKKTKLIVNIIFIVIAITMFVSIIIPTLKSYTPKITTEQTVFLNNLLEKNRDFSLESDKTKIATQSFLDTITNKEWAKMHERLEHLLIATQTLQPKIEEMKLISQQSIDLSTNEQEKQAGIIYAKSIEIRDRQNKKVAELATFGLTIDWENPTEEQMAKWVQLADELGTIENEIINVQTELGSS